MPAPYVNSNMHVCFHPLAPAPSHGVLHAFLAGDGLCHFLRVSLSPCDTVPWRTPVDIARSRAPLGTSQSIFVVSQLDRRTASPHTRTIAHFRNGSQCDFEDICSAQRYRTHRPINDQVPVWMSRYDQVDQLVHKYISDRPAWKRFTPSAQM